ncbi:BA14K family protein [Bartonella grahamii]|uniref:BA14K family protein n=1 Tax=Bartonella grahamii TaxID=33045 RepID=UPI002E7AE220|nr:BA14K family protein [Bartonella grahamii]
MKKVIKFAVLSAMSTVTVLMPVDATLADMAWDHSNYVTRKIDNTMSDINKRIDDTMRNMNRRADFSSRNFSSYSSHSKHHPSFDKPHPHHHVNHRRTKYHHHHVEHNTYNYVERKTTKRSNIHINNSGDALAMGILGLATGTILGTILKKPEQPQVVYQVHQTVGYEPLQQSLESDWLNYCKKKYRSFNPKTGTFRDRNGLEHICYAPIN